MADQQFLASFGVDIDESGVSRLQKILSENRTLADSLSASFDAASENTITAKACYIILFHNYLAESRLVLVDNFKR